MKINWQKMFTSLAYLLLPIDSKVKRSDIKSELKQYKKPLAKYDPDILNYLLYRRKAYIKRLAVLNNCKCGRDHSEDILNIFEELMALEEVLWACIPSDHEDQVYSFSIQ